MKVILYAADVETTVKQSPSLQQQNFTSAKADNTAVAGSEWCLYYLLVLMPICIAGMDWL